MSFDGFKGPIQQIDHEILAWRSWKLDYPFKPLALRSVYMGVQWEGPVMRAHLLPEADNCCGVYGLKERPTIEPYDYEYAEYVLKPVSGIVALSGRVVEGEHGYRAEIATIRALRLSFNWQSHGTEQQLVDVLSERYQCPVTVEQDDWAEWVRRQQEHLEKLYGGMGYVVYVGGGGGIAGSSIRAGQAVKITNNLIMPVDPDYDPSIKFSYNHAMPVISPAPIIQLDIE